MNRIALITALAVGCSGDKHSGHTGHTEDLDMIACGYAGEVAMSPTASEDRASAPEVHIAEHGHGVALPDAVAGYIKLVPTADGMVHVYADKTDIITGFWQGETEGDVPMSAGANPHCPDEISAVYMLDVMAGDVYLELGPTSEDSVWIMALASSGDHDHEE